MTAETWMTRAEAVEKYGIKKTSLSHWVYIKEVATKRQGRLSLVLAEDVERAMQKRYGLEGPPPAEDPGEGADELWLKRSDVIERFGTNRSTLSVWVRTGQVAQRSSGGPSQVYVPDVLRKLQEQEQGSNASAALPPRVAATARCTHGKCYRRWEEDIFSGGPGGKFCTIHAEQARQVLRRSSRGESGE